MATTVSEDETFLANSEINFFLRHMFSQVVALRPDDSIDYATKYFKRIQSCHHVLGADYAYIGATKSNRRAFIFCLMEVFQTYAQDSLIAASEYQQLVDMISPEFPRKIIADAAASIEPARSQARGVPRGDNAPRYEHGKLRISLYFHIVYEEWLKYIETIFREEGSLECLSIFRLRAYLDDCRRNWSISFSQPPSEGVDAALASLTGTEESFVGLMRALFAAPCIQADVTTVPDMAIPLLQEPEKTKKGRKGSSAQAQAPVVAQAAQAAPPESKPPTPAAPATLAPSEQ